jgi:cysteinyl-tRNA synthetase
MSESKKRQREKGGDASSGKSKKKLKLGDLIDMNSLEPQTKKIVQAKLLMHKRDKAREENNFDKSDELRSRLSAIGVDVCDQLGGPSVSAAPLLCWYICNYYIVMDRCWYRECRHSHTNLMDYLFQIP